MSIKKQFKNSFGDVLEVGDLIVHSYARGGGSVLQQVCLVEEIRETCVKVRRIAVNTWHWQYRDKPSPEYTRKGYLTSPNWIRIGNISYDPAAREQKERFERLRDALVDIALKHKKKRDIEVISDNL